MALNVIIQGVSNFFASVAKSYSVTIQMKATEQYFPVVLFIMLCKVVLSFESVDGILKCDHSNKVYLALLSCGAVFCCIRWFKLLNL